MPKKKTVISKPPIFIPKAMDKSIAELGLKYQAVLMDAHIISWRPGVAQEVKAVTDFFIVNPATHRLLFKASKDAVNFKKLSYPDFQIEKLYSDPDFRVNKIVGPCIQDQLKKGADVIIAPYFFAEDTDDTKFSLNISLTAETITYLEQNKIDLPLYAMICMGSPVLTKPIVVNYILDRYRDDFTDKLSGYFVAFSDLDDRKADEDTLIGLSNLVFQLSKDHLVFACSIGAFGEVLSAVGGGGFCSGLSSGESLSVKHLQKKPGKMKSRLKEWTYIPEILDYANDGEIKKIGYKCNCRACAGKVPVDAASKKLHFFYRKMEVMQALSKIPYSQRIDFMKERVDTAKKLALGYKQKFNSPFKTNHLDVWHNILEAAKTWSHDDDTEELDQLLKDLESKQQ